VSFNRLLPLSACIALSACASIPYSAELCEHQTRAAIATGNCATSLSASQVQTVGGVQQRGSQTRTVGVPREFLIAMIVLLVIFALA
jgi:hypothetical protein